LHRGHRVGPACACKLRAFLACDLSQSHVIRAGVGDKLVKQGLGKMKKRFGVVAALCLVFGMSAAQADSFMLQDGAVTASGHQISISRLPVRQDNGKIVYKDIIMQFSLDKNKMALTNGYPKVTNSIEQDQGTLIRGDYKVEGANPTTILTLEGPYQGPMGRTRWTLANKGTSNIIEFYPGPLKGHPQEQRIQDAKISAPYTFGLAYAGMANVTIYKNSLVAIDSLDGKRLQLFAYTNGGGQDQSLPVYIYTLVRQ